MKENPYLKIVSAITELRYKTQEQIEMMNLLKELKNTETTCINRGTFIDWMLEHHPVIVESYLENNNGQKLKI